jgi:hypothetical protein
MVRGLCDEFAGGRTGAADGLRHPGVAAARRRLPGGGRIVLVAAALSTKGVA